MPADYSRIHRLLRILTLIQAENGWNPRRLAEYCQTSQRTIYRDMDALEAAGIPCHFDDETGGYRVRRDFFMPPVELTLEESLALTLLGQQIGRDEQVPFTSPAVRAIEKIRTRLPANIREPIEQIDQHVAVRLAQRQPGEGTHDVYQLIRAAIAERRVLECEYESIEANHHAGEEDQPSPEIFQFRPYTLFFAKRAWYAVGHHGGRDELRKLKLSRFASVKMTDRPYQIPDDFSLDEHLGLAWWMIAGQERHDIELWFDPRFAETVADTHWHSTQQIEWHDDGSITFRCTVDGLDEIVWWILSMGPFCLVKQPPELAERVNKLASQTAARYDRS